MVSKCNFCFIEPFYYCILHFNFMETTIFFCFEFKMRKKNCMYFAILLRAIIIKHNTQYTEQYGSILLYNIKLMVGRSISLTIRKINLSWNKLIFSDLYFFFLHSCWHKKTKNICISTTFFEYTISKLFVAEPELKKNLKNFSVFD
jgi:hypothetical protein